VFSNSATGYQRIDNSQDVNSSVDYGQPYKQKLEDESCNVHSLPPLLFRLVLKLFFSQVVVLNCVFEDLYILGFPIFSLRVELEEKISPKKEQLFERVRKLLLARKIYTDSPVFEKLEKYGIYTYSDFEKPYPKVPIQILENFVDSLEIEEEEEELFRTAFYHLAFLIGLQKIVDGDLYKFLYLVEKTEESGCYDVLGRHLRELEVEIDEESLKELFENLLRHRKKKSEEIDSDEIDDIYGGEV